MTFNSGRTEAHIKEISEWLALYSWAGAKIVKEHLLVCRLAIDKLYKNFPEISKVDEITTDWLK